MALPLQAEAAGVDEEVAVGAIRRGLAELFAQVRQLPVFLLGAVPGMDEGQIGAEFGSVEGDRRAGVDLVVEGAAEGVLLVQAQGRESPSPAALPGMAW